MSLFARMRARMRARFISDQETAPAEQASVSLAELAEWERGNPIIERRLENLIASFEALAFELRYGQEPTRLGYGTLVMLGDQAVRTSVCFWGRGANEEPDHVWVMDHIVAGLKAVETRLAEAEAIRGALLAQCSKPAASVTDGPPAKKLAKVAIAEIAERILSAPDAPAKGHGHLTRLADRVEAELRRGGRTDIKRNTIERNLR